MNSNVLAAARADRRGGERVLADRVLDRRGRDRGVRRGPAHDGPRLGLPHEGLDEPVPGRPGVRVLRLEPEQPAGAGGLGAGLHQRRHLGHEGALDVRGHVLCHLLLAQRGPLELLHQLPALGGAQDLVRHAQSGRNGWNILYLRFCFNIYAILLYLQLS